jgi:hypothetical protein
MAKVVIKKRAAPPAPQQRRPEPQDVRPGKGVAKIEKAGPPANLMDRMMEDAGKGVSSAPEDNLVPMMGIVQDKHPEADKHHQRYIKGVEGGQIWLKNAADPFMDGAEGLIVQHCAGYKSIVEWRPRGAGGGGGAGFVAQHPYTMDIGDAFKDARQEPVPGRPNRFKWIRKNGNELVDTRYEVVRIFMEDGDRLQYVIPFTSTGHSVARGWNTLRNRFHLPNGAVAPSFARTYRMTTKSKSNDAGTWFLFLVEDDDWLPKTAEGLADYEAGLALHNAFNKGEKGLDTSTLDDSARGAEEDERV